MDSLSDDVKYDWKQYGANVTIMGESSHFIHWNTGPRASGRTYAMLRRGYVHARLFDANSPDTTYSTVSKRNEVCFVFKSTPSRQYAKEMFLRVMVPPSECLRVYGSMIQTTDKAVFNFILFRDVEKLLIGFCGGGQYGGLLLVDHECYEVVDDDVVRTLDFLFQISRQEAL